MGLKSKNPKKKWEHGKDMPELSTASWKDLQDQWPAEIRIASDAWKIISVSQPAWVAMRPFMKELLNGESIGFRDFQMLCLIYRAQEAKDGYGTQNFPILKSLNIGGTLWYARKSKINKLGLVESRQKVRVYRVTGLGIALIKRYIENLEQAHKDLRHWISIQPDEQAREVIKYLNRFWPEWNQ